jgi:predicted HTH domain antitoxin
MPLTITDEAIRDAGLSERDMLIEIACRLFDADKLTKRQASRLAQMERPEFDDELRKRNLPVIHYTHEMLAEDMATLEKMKKLTPDPSIPAPTTT